MSNAPVLYDLFCGAGGAAMGYHRAGFEVVGIDNKPQKNYPFEFVQMDALDFLQEVIDGERPKPDVIHASPPCQAYGQAKNVTSAPNMARLVSYHLNELGIPYVLENIPGAPIRADLILCGSMFDLRTHRHRWFESNVEMISSHHQEHQGRRAKDLSQYMRLSDFDYIIVTSGRCPKADAEIAMGIDWMSGKELTQAIPPAYTEFIGRQLINRL